MKAGELTLERRLSISEAAYLAGKSPDTIKRWCKLHKIGQQLATFNPWRVDPTGLAIVMSGDASALAAYKAGNLDHPSVLHYRLNGKQ